MASITFHPVIFAHHEKEDGTINVKIRLTFKRKDRKIPTNIYVTKADLTRGGKLKNQATIDKLDAEVRRLRSLCDDLNAFALESMDVDDVLAHIRRRQSSEEEFHLDFFAFGRECADARVWSSAKTYRTALHSFASFLGRDTMDISEVTSSLMRSYESWMVERYGKGARAVSQYIGCIATIHGQARKRYNSEELDKQPIRNPFDYYTPPRQAPAKVGHRNTDLDTLRMMVAERESLEGMERLGVDLFLISFALMGANTPDIYAMMPAVDGVLSYNRQKTRRRADKAPCKIRIEECVEGLLAEYADATKMRAFSFHHRYKEYYYLGQMANKGLKDYCERKGIGHLTIYSARHTWATMAYALGIPSHIITDALVHKDSARAMDDIYTNKDWSLVWDANLRVISPVFSSDLPAHQA